MGLMTRRLDESCEFVLPLDCLVRSVFNAPKVPWSSILRIRSPAVQGSADILKELVKRVLEIKEGTMAVYAMIVEERVRLTMVSDSRRVFCSTARWTRVSGTCRIVFAWMSCDLGRARRRSCTRTSCSRAIRRKDCCSDCRTMDRSS